MSFLNYVSDTQVRPAAYLNYSTPAAFSQLFSPSFAFRYIPVDQASFSFFTRLSGTNIGAVNEWAVLGGCITTTTLDVRQSYLLTFDMFCHATDFLYDLVPVVVRHEDDSAFGSLVSAVSFNSGTFTTGTSDLVVLPKQASVMVLANEDNTPGEQAQLEAQSRGSIAVDPRKRSSTAADTVRFIVGFLCKTQPHALTAASEIFLSVSAGFHVAQGSFHQPLK